METGLLDDWIMVNQELLKCDVKGFKNSIVKPNKRKKRRSIILKQRSIQEEKHHLFFQCTGIKLKSCIMDYLRFRKVKCLFGALPQVLDNRMSFLHLRKRFSSTGLISL